MFERKTHLFLDVNIYATGEKHVLVIFFQSKYLKGAPPHESDVAKIKTMLSLTSSTGNLQNDICLDIPDKSERIFVTLLFTKLEHI